MGLRRWGAVGLALISAGGLLSIGPSLPSLEVGRLILGIGGALVMTASPALLAQWFPRERIAFGMGLFGLNMPLATILSFNFLGWTGSILGWRSALFITIIISLIGLLAWSSLAEERPADMKFSPSLMMEKRLWILGLVWAAFNMAVISFTTWSPKLFRDLWRLAPAYSNFLASLLMMGALLTPLTGHLSDRLGRRSLIMAFSALGLAVILLIMPMAPSLYLAPVVILLGLIAAFIPPSVFALPLEILSGRNIGVGYGILNTCLNVGIVAGPLITGLIIDMAHDKVVIYSSMAAFALFAMALSLALGAAMRAKPDP